MSAGTDRFVRWVVSELTGDTVVNLTVQYRPNHRANELPSSVNRRVTGQAWRRAMSWVRGPGLHRIAGV